MLVDVEALEKCYQVRDLLCEQCVKQQAMNEVLAMKMHYISLSRGEADPFYTVASESVQNPSCFIHFTVV